MTTSLSEVAICLPRNFSMMKGHRLHFDLCCLQKLVETATKYRIPVHVDDDCRFDIVSSRHHRIFGLCERRYVPVRIGLTTQDSNYCGGINYQRGSPLSS